jgi:hypothetical protein
MCVCIYVYIYTYIHTLYGDYICIYIYYALYEGVTCECVETTEQVYNMCVCVCVCVCVYVLCRLHAVCRYECVENKRGGLPSSS